MAGSLRYSLARVGRWPRLIAALACVLLAVVSALEAHGARSATPTVRTAAVVVAARALPAGHALHRRDLSIARWPSGLAPPGARADPRRLIGRRLAGPLDAQEPVSSPRLVGTSLTRGLADGTVATPVDLDTDVRAFVRAGDRVDLVAIIRPDTEVPDATTAGGNSADSAGSVVARRLLVLAVYRADDVDPPVSRVILATPRELALRIVALRANRLFTLVGDSP